ncbi:MAG: hypothetical protein KDK70_07105 [Myxococcales bacterium]|nr:hypothetical protein [Myxococcales bacterium]
MRSTAFLSLVLLSTACLTRPVGDEPEDGSTSAGDDVVTTVSPPATVPPSTTSTSGDDTTSIGPDTEGVTTEAEPTLGEGEECQLEGFAEILCGPGLKCMPYDSSGTSFYDAAACFPIDPNPVGLYEPCVWYGGAWSGYDNCGDHAFCADYDGDGEGTCTGICIWTADDWDAYYCEDPAAEGSWGCQSCFCSCEVPCDPLQPDACGDGNACVPTSHPDFLCVPDASAELGDYGDPCEYINGCDPGLFCANPASVPAPGCDQALGCCTPFCDLTQPNTCPGALEGQECLPWYEDPANAPAGFEDVGGCSLPL